MDSHRRQGREAEMIQRFHSFIFIRRHKAACRKLQKMVEANRKSPACRDYRKHRDAALRRVT